jgi:hypothetical protein
MRTLAIILLLCITACRPTHTEENTVQNKFPETLSIQLGETGPELAKRYPTLLDLNKQPAGINFYQLNPIYLKQKVKTIFNLKQYSIEIPFTLSIMGTEDADIPKEGIYVFDINAVFSEKEKNSDEYVRIQINNLLQQVRAKGWRPLFYYDAPRLRGQEQFDYALAEHSFELDGAMDISPHNWQRIDWIASTSWMFYADNVFAEINFRRSPTWEDPKQPGTALLSVKFQSMESFLRLEIEEKDRANWRAFWPAKAKWYRERRDSAEIRLHKEGKHIDLHYQDPPLPPPPPGQRNPELPPEVTRPAHPLIKSSARVPLQRDALPLGTTRHTGESCPQSGIWHAQFPPHSISNRQPGYNVQRFFAQGSLLPALPVHYPRLLGRWLGYPAQVEPVRWILMAYQ